MKVMILSDSHHISKTDLLTLLKNNRVDYYIHCGDIYKSFDKITLPNPSLEVITMFFRTSF